MSEMSEEPRGWAEVYPTADAGPGTVAGPTGSAAGAYPTDPPAGTVNGTGNGPAMGKPISNGQAGALRLGDLGAQVAADLGIVADSWVGRTPPSDSGVAAGSPTVPVWSSGDLATRLAGVLAGSDDGADSVVAPAAPSVADRMQELLSKAVEEQVSEQRSLAAALEGIRSEIAHLPRIDPADLHDLLAASNDQVTGRMQHEVARAAEEVVAGLAELRQRLDESVAALGGLLEGLAEQGSLEELADGLAGVRTDIHVLPGQVAQGLAGALTHAVSVGLADARGAMDELTDLSRALVGDVAGLQTRLGSLDHTATDLAQVRARVEDLPVLRTEIAAGLGSVGSDLAAVLTRLTATDARVSAHLAAVTPLGPGLTALDHRLDALEGNLTGLRTEIASLGTSAPLALEVTALRSDLESLRRLVIDDLPSLLPDAASLGTSLGEEVREAIRATLRESVRDLVRDAVRDSVRLASLETERRLADHVDTAVLALAEALLRRRATPRPGMISAPAAPAVPATGPTPDEATAPVARPVTPPAGVRGAETSTVPPAGGPSSAKPGDTLTASPVEPGLPGASGSPDAPGGAGGPGGGDAPSSPPAESAGAAPASEPPAAVPDDPAASASSRSTTTTAGASARPPAATPPITPAGPVSGLPEWPDEASGPRSEPARRRSRWLSRR